MNSDKVLRILIIVFLVVFGVVVVFDFRMQSSIDNYFETLSLSPVSDDGSEGSGERRCECTVLEGAVKTPTDNPYITYKAIMNIQCPEDLEMCTDEYEGFCSVIWSLQKVGMPDPDDLDYFLRLRVYLFWVASRDKPTSDSGEFLCGVV